MLYLIFCFDITVTSKYICLAVLCRKLGSKITPKKGKRKRTCSRTPPSKRKEQQERRKSLAPTPAAKRKKTSIEARKEEASALETGTLTPVRRIL